MPDPTLHDHAALAHLAGWHPLLLPAGCKGPPPEGRTGAAGVDLSLWEIAALPWDGNLGVRMPPDVIGLDVDAYRGGLDTLRRLEGAHGKLPPTVISHSGRDDGSGIRFYLVPTGWRWVSSLPGIDVIQRDHRYAAIAPSVHPDGRRYGWWDQTEGAPWSGDGPPPVEDLPRLDWPWITLLAKGEDPGASTHPVDAGALAAFLEANVGTLAPSYLSAITAHFVAEVAGGRSRHDSMQHCLTWAAESARAGLFPARVMVATLGLAWGEVHDDSRRAELWSAARVTEYEAMVRHAVGKAEAKSDEWLSNHRLGVVGPVMVTVPAVPSSPVWVDWSALATRDTTNRWLVEGFWPWGRGMALWASAKTGKSELALWCAVRLAQGVHPWTGAPCEPVDVAYFDHEMTVDDLVERLDVLDVDPATLGRLHYAIHPPIGATDTQAGGDALVALATEVGAVAVVIDTFGRSVDGDEDKADTVRAFYRHTGARLKAAGIGYLRTDHAGKDESKGQRGSSAKRDDVDVAWRMQRHVDGVALDCTGSSRLSWVGPKLKLLRSVDPEDEFTVSYHNTVTLGPTAEVLSRAAELASLGMPPGLSCRAALAWMKERGHVPGRSILFQQARKYVGCPPGTTPSSGSGMR